MRKLFVSPINTDLGILALRLVLGGLFFYHGLDALQHYQLYSSYSTRSYIGLSLKTEFALVVYAQFICGLFVALGFLTRLSVIPLLFSMIIAFFIAHKNDPFLTVSEKAFMFMVLCIPVLIFGSGKFSIDNLVFRKRS